MATQPAAGPLTLAATSAAEDLGFVSITDLFAALPADGDFRLVGGHMVALHVHRWQLSAELYRETADSDLGTTPHLLADETLYSGSIPLAASAYPQRLPVPAAWELSSDRDPVAMATRSLFARLRLEPSREITAPACVSRPDRDLGVIKARCGRGIHWLAIKMGVAAVGC